jgi:hypothetical protein
MTIHVLKFKRKGNSWDIRLFTSQGTKSTSRSKIQPYWHDLSHLITGKGFSCPEEYQLRYWTLDHGSIIWWEDNYLKFWLQFFPSNVVDNIQAVFLQDWGIIFYDTITNQFSTTLGDFLNSPNFLQNFAKREI